MINREKYNALIITFPHIVNCSEDSILKTSFHVWEHVFVRHLTRILGNKIKIYGLTNCMETKLVIKDYNCRDLKQYINLKDAVKEMKDYCPSIEELQIEIKIINSELAALSYFYNISLGNFHSISTQKYNDFLDFKKISYNWENVTMKSIIHNHCDDDSKNEGLIKHLPDEKTSATRISPQNMLATYRGNIIKKYFDDQVLLPKYEIKIENSHNLILMVINVSDFYSKNKIMHEYTKMDSVGGFFENVVINKFGLSYIVWPSINEIDSRKYLTAFACVEKERINDFIEIIIDEIANESELTKYEKNLLKKNTNYILFPYRKGEL
ncbi:hypothetical protein LGL55_18485 [Clostridium tagluense]|uniref:hypothetical protein n=1 Tax=Clostridium tagluense TaxID=360422 RepID=UPI001CF44D33|nr:hypothetical protein [Clostridium tagluense]MCB2313236.1 hypothetical protein [Clostridium tagluense]MCB2318013.1 hypothetical protein [Clostridium tagluense]MCB2322791.1 hypothetical protein [Clostridium tagluense]MCB2327797.1 hypothetical protein [Clostridium tagluense]MCB2332444.1 hypothetical protein [Clostridium tagluense]